MNSPEQEEKIRPEVETLLKENDCNIQYGSVSDNATSPEPISRSTRIYNILITMTIEPIMFCYMFGFIMNMAVLTNLMMEMGCVQNLNYSTLVCQNLSAHETEKKKVEDLATDFSLYFHLLSIIGAFMMIFIAPWSDTYGRKPPLVCVIVGSIATDVMFILCTVYNTRIEYLLVAKLPSEVFGGFICALTIIYSHASEVSTEKTRTLKYTMVEIAMGLGMATGGMTGGFLARYSRYVYIYATVACLHAFCLFWAIIVLKETRGLNLTVTWSKKLRDFFDCRNFRSGIRATFRARHGYKRAIIVLLLLSMCVIVLTYESLGSIGFVYVFHIYNWDVTTYNILTTSVSLFQMVVTMVCVPLFIGVFKMQDFTLGVIGAISMMVKNYLIAFAPKHQAIYYAAQLSGILGQLSTLTVRSGLSKLVDRDELGKVFSFLATCESILPMVGNIAVTKLFEATIDSFPNIAYSVTVLLLLLPVSTFIWASIVNKPSFESSAPALREKA